MSTIRERDAADPGPLWATVTGYREAVEDRHSVLIALQVLVVAADAVCDAYFAYRGKESPLLSEPHVLVLREAVATARKAIDG